MGARTRSSGQIHQLSSGSFRVRVQGTIAPYGGVFKSHAEAEAALALAQEAAAAARRQAALRAVGPRLLRRMTIDEATGCWLFKGPYTSFGYGKFRVLRKHLTAHRASYETFVGPIQEGLFVCHRCDVPRCIRPEHLFLGTPLDNMQDMVAKGRARTGPRGARAKLSLEAADEIRAMRDSGATCATIAVKYGVRPVTIRRVLSGRVWARSA